MKNEEIKEIIIAIAVLGFISGFVELVRGDIKILAITLVFGAIIIGANILSKKIMASRLDADVEHEIWKMNRYGLKPGDRVNKSIWAGVIIPLFVTIVTLGSINLMTILT